MDRNKGTVTTDLISQGIDQFILRRTVRIHDLTDANGGGTGVTILARNRYFVATAAHVMVTGHEFGVLLRDGTSEFLTAFSQIHLCEHGDIALIELAEGQNERMSASHDFVTEDELYKGRYPHRNVPITIVGYPSFVVTQSAPVRLSPELSAHFVGFGTLNYETNCLTRAEWPVGPDFPTRSARTHDIFCKYRPGHQPAIRRDMQRLDSPELEGAFTKVPLNGMSGGGIWIPYQFNKPSGVTFMGAKLLGIQSSYPRDGKGRWIRGTRIQALKDVIERI
jgi:hypothetical protein